jgi:T-complex protein 1 subunit gamma
VFPGVVLNKDVIDGGMRRRIENPRVIILDCGLEFKKGESQLTIEAKSDKDFEEVMRQEELAVKKMIEDILKFRPDLVISEKGISDLAQHYLKKAGVSALRRMKKTDSNRIARAVGARIVQRTDEIKEADVGTGCALFEVRKIGDEYVVYHISFSFVASFSIFV